MAAALGGQRAVALPGGAGSALGVLQAGQCDLACCRCWFNSVLPCSTTLPCHQLLTSHPGNALPLSPIPPPQIGAKVVAGERLELLPRQELPGPDTAAFGGLDAYCALIQECWAAQPEQRPGMAQVVRRLRGLLEQHSGAAAAGQAAGGGG